jgi:hypothetical protein
MKAKVRSTGRTEAQARRQAQQQQQADRRLTRRIRKGQGGLHDEVRDSRAPSSLDTYEDVQDEDDLDDGSALTSVFERDEDDLDLREWVDA